MNIWCESLWANRLTLSSMLGQYLGPTPSIMPVNIGERANPERNISWVFALVWVIQHGICFGCICDVPRSEKQGILPSKYPSPFWISNFEKSMVRPSRRGGVPVLRRPCGSCNSLSLIDKAQAASSPVRPPALDSSPICILPSKKDQPGQNNGWSEKKEMPLWVLTPLILPFSSIRSSTAWEKNQKDSPAAPISVSLLFI